VKLELRYLTTPRGTSIAALDYEARRPRGVTLVAGHGYSSSKHNLDPLCSFLSSHGYRVISVDFPGHKLGASGGVLASIADLTGAIATAVAYARASGGETIYTMGHSMGASTALRACAADAAIAGAISIATGYGRPSAVAAISRGGVVDLRSSYVDGLTLPELVTEVDAVLDEALAALAGRPVLYIAASRDGMVSRASAQELFDRAPEPKEFAMIESDHTYAGENARAAVLAWLNARHER
jgi:alpha-beta hydrolase superfamily lysophospholipase